jgi:hypothetical protein
VVGAIQSGHLPQTCGYASAGAAITLVCLVGMAAIWFGPETRDKPLPA